MQNNAQVGLYDKQNYTCTQECTDNHKHIYFYSMFLTAV